MSKLISNDVKVDAIITDIPYGTTACPWDIVIPFEPMWSCIKEIRKDDSPILLFGNEPFNSYLRISNINEYKYDIYWQKERATNIFQLKKRPAKVIETINVFYKEQPTYNPQMTDYNGPKRTNKIKNGKLGGGSIRKTDGLSNTMIQGKGIRCRSFNLNEIYCPPIFIRRKSPSR